MLVDALREDLRAPTRWPVLDGIRGLAVLSVVLYHALRLLVLGEGSQTSESYTAWWWPVMTGRLALDVFFVLSGFLIVESWSSLRRRSDTWHAALREYGTRRLARILPGYYASLAVLVPLVAPHLLGSPGDLALFASLQQYLRPGLPSEVNVVYWSLTTEIHFYALAPLAALVMRRFGAGRLVAVCLAGAVAWQATRPGDLPASLVWGRLDQFVLGAALSPLVASWTRGERRPLLAAVSARHAGRLLAVGFGACGVWQGALLAGHVQASAPLLHPVTGVVVAGGLLRFLTSERESALANPMLRLAGLLSYGVYLFHFPILEYGFRWLGLAAGEPTSPALAVGATAALTLVSLVVGGASYVLVERPVARRVAERARGRAQAQHPPVGAGPAPTWGAWAPTPATSTSSSASLG